MEEKFPGKKAAQYLGISHGTWRNYRSEGRIPEPDGIDDTFGKQYWIQATLDRIKPSLPGQGARTDLKKESSDLEKSSG